MHPFMIIGGVLHATAVAIVAFFVFFAASRSTGLLQAFGRLLGWWLILLAFASIAFAASGMGGKHMHGWMMHDGDHGPPAAAAPAAPPAAAS
jgi:hypothetical protein